MASPEQHSSLEGQTRNSLETQPDSREARRKHSFFSEAADKLKDLFRKDSHQDDESRPQIEQSEPQVPTTHLTPYPPHNSGHGQDHAGEPDLYRVEEWHSVSQFFAATQEDGPSNYYETDLWIWWQHRFCRARGTHCPDSSCPEKPKTPTANTSIGLNNDMDTFLFDRHPRKSSESDHWRDRRTRRRSSSEHTSWREKFRLRKRPSKKSRGKQRDYSADEPQLASRHTQYIPADSALLSSYEQSSRPAAQGDQRAETPLQLGRSEEPERPSQMRQNSSPIPKLRQIGRQSPDQLMVSTPKIQNPVHDLSLGGW